jgi:hypothetical protein
VKVEPITDRFRNPKKSDQPSQVPFADVGNGSGDVAQQRFDLGERLLWPGRGDRQLAGLDDLGVAADRADNKD